MLGRVVYMRTVGKSCVEMEKIGGMTLARGTLYEPEGTGRRRAERRVRKLRKLLERQGVWQLMLPEGFPHADAFARFAGVDVLPFFRAVADLFALGALRMEGKEPERAIIALSASRLSPFLTLAAERLCPRVRGLCIDVPGEGARYSGWLHRQYGLPVSPPAGADVTVAFSPGGGRWGRVLELSEERVELGGLETAVPGLDLPRGYAERLQAALWERGLLERGSVRVQPTRPLDKRW